MDDQELHTRITALVGEEHQLERAHAGRPMSDEERSRLTELGEQLDRCWDLLRQREARRDAGLDPVTTHERPAKTVEGYLQ